MSFNVSMIAGFVSGEPTVWATSERDGAKRYKIGFQVANNLREGQDGRPETVTAAGQTIKVAKGVEYIDVVWWVSEAQRSGPVSKIKVGTHIAAVCDIVPNTKPAIRAYQPEGQERKLAADFKSVFEIIGNRVSIGHAKTAESAPAASKAVAVEVDLSDMPLV